jgi:hypothetical protein
LVLSVKLEFREIGLCPKCSAPIEYYYTLSGPEGEDGVRIYVISECPICGFKDSKNLLFPIDPVHSIRHLFQPTVKIFIEKVKLAKELKRFEEAKVVGGTL